MRPSLERLRTILERQDKPLFGPEYRPAILATRREAPSISRPSTVYWHRLGRDVHLLSSPERAAALLAMYHSGLFELHEQKMLSVNPRAHPMAGHPAAVGLKLPPVRGTVDVANRLGHLSFHPKVKAPRQEGSNEWMWVPYPYIGDLLLFLQDQDGPYCVNWSIKLHPEDFDRPASRADPIRNPSVAAHRVQARHEIERVYYEDAGIRTVRIAKTNIDLHVVTNLTQLFGWHLQAVPLDEGQRAEMVTKYETALELGITPIDVIGQLILRHRYRREDCLAVLYQAIWTRRLRIDLFRPLLVDRPLRPEKRDVIKVYAEWFERRPCISASS